MFLTRIFHILMILLKSLYQKFYYEIINGRPKGKLFNRAKNNKLKDPSEQEIEQIANVQEVIIPVIEIEGTVKF